MRALLRRQLGRATFSSPLLRRAQHSYPHKEYFQTPIRSARPDVSHIVLPVAPSTAQSDPSYLERGLRSVLWTFLFGTLGVAAGIGAITWEYLQPPFEPGT